jgi:hypothetical protein
MSSVHPIERVVAQIVNLQRCLRRDEQHVESVLVEQWHELAALVVKDFVHPANEYAAEFERDAETAAAVMDADADRILGG